ncbi:hypothetical protein D3C77_539320 [compost metagenome]
MKKKSNAAIYKAAELANTLSNIESCLATLVKEKCEPFQSLNQLTIYIGNQIDLDPSVFRKKEAKHRKLLNKYVHLLVSRDNKPKYDNNTAEALQIKNLELKRKVAILENELKKPTSKLHLLSNHTNTQSSDKYEIDNLCMLINDILKCQHNLKFKDGQLYNYETFSEDEELVSDAKKCETYLEWKNGR